MTAIHYAANSRALRAKAIGMSNQGLIQMLSPLFVTLRAWYHDVLVMLSVVATFVGGISFAMVLQRAMVDTVGLERVWLVD